MRTEETQTLRQYEVLRRNKLSLTEQIALAERYLHGDKKARDELIYSCWYIVQKWATHYRFTEYPLEDRIQEGFLGLLNAIEKFRIEKGHKFSTYAFDQVRGAIQVRIRAYRTKRTLETESPKPIHSEIHYIRNPNSPNPSDEVEKADTAERIRAIVRKLPKKYQQIVVNHFGLNNKPPENLRTMAKRIGVSKSTVYNWFSKAMEMLKEDIIADLPHN